MQASSLRSRQSAGSPLRRLRVDLHPLTALSIVLAVLALALWCVATTGYAFFHDQVLIGITERHALIERTSRAEIQRLRDEIQRISSSRLVEQQTVAGKLDALAERQARTTRRQDEIIRLLGSGDEVETSPAVPEEAAPEPEDMPLRQSHGFLTPTDDGSPILNRLDTLGGAYDRLEHIQTRAIAALKRRYEHQRARLDDVYARLGLNRDLKKPVQASIGGPFLPTSADPAHKLGTDLAALVNMAAEAEDLRDGLSQIPVRSPLPGAQKTSGFGTRMDPFLRAPAFHSGVDLRAASGSAARATGDGTVVTAGWTSGYGLMVEIRHSSGTSTRYGHLSSVSVREGQVVSAGDMIGRVGSTGRSTGPHLHYEVRINGEPVNPDRFLAVGTTLASLH